MTMKHSLKTKGFTLVETLVAISILMLAILGPLTIASAGLKNSLYARDQITAYYLAQEGIEHVRYVRDDNYIRNLNGENRDWMDGLRECLILGSGDYGCTIDIPDWFFNGNNPVARCTTSACSTSLLALTSNGYYTHQQPNGTSRYSRVITIEYVGNTSDEAKVTSKVKWRTGFGEREFELYEHVFNIYKDL